jgi:hypothetical protein
VTDVLEPLRRIGGRYAQGEDRPLRGYLLLDVAYVSLVGGLGLAARKRGVRLPERVSTGDLLLLGVATHKLARTVAKDAVTSPLRAPFNRYEGPAGPAELQEEIVADGVPHAVGELVSCPFCLAQWIATGFVAGLVTAPRATRLVAATFTAVALSDFLQLAYSIAGQRAQGN